MCVLFPSIMLIPTHYMRSSKQQKRLVDFNSRKYSEARSQFPLTGPQCVFIFAEFCEWKQAPICRSWLTFHDRLRKVAVSVSFPPLMRLLKLANRSPSIRLPRVCHLFFSAARFNCS